MAQKIIDNVVANPTPKSMMQAIDDNFTELYAEVSALNPSRVYAYLSTAAPTTVVLANTFYPILGTFVNDPMVGFSIVAGKLTYGAGLPNMEAHIQWDAAVSCSGANAELHIGIAVNGEVLNINGPNSRGTFCKNAGQAYALSGAIVVPISSGATIELQIASSNAGDTLTVMHLGTTLRRFV